MYLIDLQLCKDRLKRTIYLESILLNYTPDKFEFVSNLVKSLDESAREYAQILIFEGYVRATKESLDYKILWESLYPDSPMENFSSLDEFNEKLFTISASIVKTFEDNMKTSRILRSIICDDVEEFKSQFRNEDLNRRFVFLNDQKADSPDQVSLIEYASFFGSYQICKYLLDLGANMSYRCITNSVKSGSIHCYSLFSSDVTNFAELLDIAISYHRHNFVQIFYEKVKSETSFIQSAILNKDTAFFIQCVENQEDYETNEVDPLVSSAIAGNAELFKILLQCGFDIHARDPDGNNILTITALFGHLEIAKTAIATNLYAAEDIKRASITAIDCAKEDVALFMLQHLYSHDNCAPTAVELYHAINAYCPRVVEYICKFHPDFDYKTKDGDNLLEFSLSIKKFDLTAIMLNNGADVNLIKKVDIREEPYCSELREFIPDSF
ncbi:hypothetical protein TVAG_119020 [Trichomonas vaginalis G3]|uniref:DUF3447 domain-containing protein n=1 Tax=Trichomonas vaginalis (strain ATCC PRA-98 / G3) TaxID=412133 RepID=A2D749_TRIV3|nr:Ankyrin repeat family [Trichomonas vaginalis G3]EAY23566.1 hypothetical protein TVAG_119020 [Trichomonas vaginalis G3]KAI5490064.1 Ankyrin repeat family [Trichomonas vaginalis G3]|eukprot:XP_001276814.1 hypothetical protein [Trichomonas vaginalis G3]